MKHLFSLMTCLAIAAVCAGPSLATDDFHGGDIHYEQPVMGVLFSHAYHVEEMGFDCESCHDDLFAMEAQAAQDQSDFNMQGLYEGLYCGACHDGSTAFASSTRCASCHEGVKGYNQAMGLSSTGQRGH